jgi:hypothetical protein
MQAGGGGNFKLEAVILNGVREHGGAYRTGCPRILNILLKYTHTSGAVVSLTLPVGVDRNLDYTTHFILPVEGLKIVKNSRPIHALLSHVGSGEVDIKIDLVANNTPVAIDWGDYVMVASGSRRVGGYIRS